MKLFAAVLFSFLLDTVASFDLLAHRGNNCLANQVKFVCFRVGYNFCCKNRMRRDSQLFNTFLSMSQTATQLGDFVILHKVKYGNACGGAEVGTGIYGCADAERGIPSGGKALTCRGDCGLKRSMPDEGQIAEAQQCEDGVEECAGIHLADAVYYNEKAYFARPEDERLGELVDKILDDVELTEGELQELEAIRLPWADDPYNAQPPEDFVSGRNASMPAPPQK